jgi:hypothetical protein
MNCTENIKSFHLQLQLIEDRFFRSIEEFLIHNHRQVCPHPNVMPKFSLIEFEKIPNDLLV